MNKLSYIFLLFLGISMLVACDDTETYAEMKAKERAAINKYIADSAVTVISEAQFKANNYTTDVSKNEFVLFESNGVYMQIVEKGTGSRLAEGETKEIITRHIEFNIASDSVQTTNVPSSFEWRYDVMTCTNSYGTYSATFTRDLGVMRTSYNSAAVPAGWLIPLKYINLARTMDGPDARLAKVRLIVPSSQGQANASANVYPCFYEIIYQRGAGY